MSDVVAQDARAPGRAASQARRDATSAQIHDAIRHSKQDRSDPRLPEPYGGRSHAKDAANHDMDPWAWSDVQIDTLIQRSLEMKWLDHGVGVGLLGRRVWHGRVVLHYSGACWPTKSLD